MSRHRENLGLALVIDLDDRLVGLGHELERPQLGIRLDGRVGELAADQALRVEDSVVRVHCE